MRQRKRLSLLHAKRAGVLVKAVNATLAKRSGVMCEGSERATCSLNLSEAISVLKSLVGAASLLIKDVQPCFPACHPVQGLVSFALAKANLALRLLPGVAPELAAGKVILGPDA